MRYQVVKGEFETIPCDHAAMVNMDTHELFTKEHELIKHSYCPSCGYHKFRGKEYTKQEWYNWINSPMD